MQLFAADVFKFRQKIDLKMSSAEVNLLCHLLCQFASIYRHYKAQRENIDAKWSLPEEYNVVYTDVAGELVVGGVFLRLFIANPGWVLRKPKEFLTELLEVWAQLVGSKNPDVSTFILSQAVNSMHIKSG